jgi:hypothetical protein
MSAPGTHDITIYKGATFRLPVVWKDSAGDPYNLTGYTARMQIRRSVGAATAEVSLTSASGITITPATGSIVAVISATDTSALTIPSGVYDLELEDAAGVVTRLLEGSVTISPEVTRA